MSTRPEPAFSQAERTARGRTSRTNPPDSTAPRPVTRRRHAVEILDLSTARWPVLFAVMAEASTNSADPSELAVLSGYLDKMRHAVVASTELLSEEQLRAPGVPSGTNLLGIVQHLTGVEDHWFRYVFLGEDLRCDTSMTVPSDVTADEVVANYRAACASSSAIVRSCGDLSTLSARPNPGEAQLDSLRVIVAHMIEETARHAGHADILREQIDGTTGH